MRIIEQLGEAWRRLMGLVDDWEARQELDRAYQRFCGLGRTEAEQLDVDTLATLLDEGQMMALSELTYLRAEWQRERLDDDTLAALYLRALALLTGIADEEIAMARAARARELVEAVGEALPVSEAIRAMGFLSLGGEYAAAEDLLFAQLAGWRRGAAPGALLLAGEAFYAELTKMDDAQLEKGDLPRAEVAQGAAELARWTRAKEDTDR